MCQEGVQKLEPWHVIYDENKYQKIIEETKLNSLHECSIRVAQTDLSIEEMKFIFDDVEDWEYSSYQVISNSNYYGEIILRLKNLKENYNNLIQGGDIEYFLNDDCIRYLILFTKVSNPWYQALKLDIFETHIYDIHDVIYVKYLLRNVPFAAPMKNYISRPSLQFTKQQIVAGKEYKLSILATPDFIVDNYIIDIKTTNSVSRRDYYQMLFYYVLAKYGYGEKYPKIKGCKLIYAKHQKIITLDFSKVINVEEGVAFNEYIVDNIILDYIETIIQIERDREEAALEREKQRIKEEKRKAAKEKAKIAKAKVRAKEKEKAAKEKEKAKAEEKEKVKAAKEKIRAKEKEKAAKAKRRAKEKEKAAKEKRRAKEKEKAAKEKEKVKVAKAAK
ncbi:MAG: hypothetical protein EBX41_00290 [Chitinophagia bacterium]|nr:hypothetical protein [Chitinophagia bacterium]